MNWIKRFKAQSRTHSLFANAAGIFIPGLYIFGAVLAYAPATWFYLVTTFLILLIEGSAAGAMLVSFVTIMVEDHLTFFPGEDK